MGWMSGLKRGSVNKQPKRLLLKKSQLKELKKRIAKRRLDEKDWDILDGMADTIDFLYMVLDEKNISLRRLLKYMLGAPTETCKKVLGENADQPEKPPVSDLLPDKPKAKGHGRNGADVYDNANKVTIEHPGPFGLSQASGPESPTKYKHSDSP